MVLEISLKMNCQRLLKLLYLLRNLWIQRIFIVFLITAVFWNGLWGGVPRADQLSYLHQISQFDDFWQIFLNSPSLNRTQTSVGEDLMLFRPLLYWLLGAFYYFFGYNFMLWQIGALFLHILVVLGVHLLLTAGRLRSTQYPLLLSIFFGTSLLGSELVLWNHITGYILFSVFSVFSIYYLIKFFDSQKTCFIWLSLFLGVLSEFTYELGLIVNLLISLTFFYKFLFKYADAKNLLLEKNNKSIKWGILFLLGSLMYPFLSVMDLWAKGLAPTISDTQTNIAQSLLLASTYTIKQIGFWVGGWLLPAAYKISAATRASFSGFEIDNLAFLLNYTVVIFLVSVIICKIGLIKKTLPLSNANTWLAPLLSLFFLFVYSFIIAYGRSLPRGLDSVLDRNIYYSYIAYLTIIITIGLFSLKNSYVDAKLDKAVDVNADKNSNLLSSKRLISLYPTRFFLSLILILLIGFNVHSVLNLSKRYRYDYSAPRQELIDEVSDYLNAEGKSGESYFIINPNCVGNDQLPWFPGHIRKNSGWVPPVSFADALWPEKSYKLNEVMLRGKNFSVTEINCIEITASSRKNEYGPEGLTYQSEPGWHAGVPVMYPQFITIDFHRQRDVRRVGFLPQDRQPNRAPKRIQVETSNDAISWKTHTNAEIGCSNNSDQWGYIELSPAVKARYLKVNILSNCGDPTYLTLRGLKFD